MFTRLLGRTVFQPTCSILSCRRDLARLHRNVSFCFYTRLPFPSNQTSIFIFLCFYLHPCSPYVCLYLAYPFACRLSPVSHPPLTLPLPTLFFPGMKQDPRGPLSLCFHLPPTVYAVRSRGVSCTKQSFFIPFPSSFIPFIRCRHFLPFLICASLYVNCTLLSPVLQVFSPLQSLPFGKFHAKGGHGTRRAKEPTASKKDRKGRGAIVERGV